MQKLRQSSGGLVSSINSSLHSKAMRPFREIVWAGVPGCSPQEWEAALQQSETAFSLMPVFMSRSVYDKYYGGFSNSLIWPLFHYFPSFAEFNDDWFDAYMKASRSFANVLEPALTESDVVWIHDYHLFPLAAMLRERIPGITIGFFLHIPFPSSELFRIIPRQWQHAILRGMLGADLIGFQTKSYTGHFLSTVEKTLGMSARNRVLTTGDRKVMAGHFPISINYEMFNDAFDKQSVVRSRKHFERIRGSQKMIFSVDRLDYTKGILNRLKGYELFLKENPEYVGKILFVLILVPSRDSISKYIERKRLINEFIGGFNSRMGYMGWQPVMYSYKHLTFDELLGLYTSCDIALITPLRDGMNLVAKEFAASRKDRRGVLILSEMAGAAEELDSALIINPNDFSEIAKTIKTAVEMGEDEQAERMERMQVRLREYSVTAWVDDFFKNLKNIKRIQHGSTGRALKENYDKRLINCYIHSKDRLILLDYDGTLVPFAGRPEDAKPDAALIELIKKLCSVPGNAVYIISGRDRATLHKWMPVKALGLIAEHGAAIKLPEERTWQTTAAQPAGWLPLAEVFFKRYAEMYPGTFIEKKEFSVVWHYRQNDEAEGYVQTIMNDEALKALVAEYGLAVLHGNKVIEIKRNIYTKGSAVLKVLSRTPVQFILAMGDDVTDEDTFMALSDMDNAFTIKVGRGQTSAQHSIASPRVARLLLGKLLDL